MSKRPTPTEGEETPTATRPAESQSVSALPDLPSSGAPSLEQVRRFWDGSFNRLGTYLKQVGDNLMSEFLIYGVAPPSRQQLLRKVLILGTSLVVTRAAPAIAAPASAVKTTARQEVKIEEENQLMPEIMHLIKIRAAQNAVYRAVSTAEDIRNWWTRDAALDPKVGGTGEFGFYGHRMVIKVKVAELTPPGYVAWDAVSSTGGGFDGTTISFDLKSEEGITSLLFAHRGFKAGGNDIAIASATTRWGFYLLSLKRYLETGKGTPNPEDTELIR